jgi:hypothetical protein
MGLICRWRKELVSILLNKHHGYVRCEKDLWIFQRSFFGYGSFWLSSNRIMGFNVAQFYCDFCAYIYAASYE